MRFNVVFLPECKVDRSRSFAVYACDSPTYPGVLGEYGREDQAQGISGSLVVISGGYWRPDPAGEGAIPDVFLSGLVDIAGGVGHRFAERGIANLVPAADRVMLVLYVSRVQAGPWLDLLRSVGFDVIETGDVVSGRHSAYAVCAGKGQMLRHAAWLGELQGYDPFFLLATDDTHSEFELATVRAARRHQDPVAAGAALIEQVSEQRRALVDVMGEYDLFAWLTGPDLNSMQLNRRDADLSSVHIALAEAARETALPLYYAGNLGEPDETGLVFKDFRGWLDWQPMPRDWKQVA